MTDQKLKIDFANPVLIDLDGTRWIADRYVAIRCDATDLTTEDLDELPMSRSIDRTKRPYFARNPQTDGPIGPNLAALLWVNRDDRGITLTVHDSDKRHTRPSRRPRLGTPPRRHRPVPQLQGAAVSDYTPQPQRFGDYYPESYARFQDVLSDGIVPDWDDEDHDRNEAQFRADLAAHDAQVAAKALRDAADDIAARANGSALIANADRWGGYYHGMRSGMQNEEQALRIRADRLEGR